MAAMRPESLYEVHPDAVDLGAPVLVHALSGFLDAGAARQLAVGHLLETYENRPVATFDIDALYDYRARRPRLVFDTDHYETVDYPELVLSEVRDDAGTGFLLLHGPEPDFAWRTFSAAVIQLVERFGVRRTIGMAAIPWPAPHTRPVGVTAHSTNPDLVAGRPTFVGAIEVPGHLAGALELALRDSGHEAMGFAAHIPHYLTQVEFPRASVALLEEVARAGDLSLDLADLVERGRRSDAEIEAQVAQSPDNVEAVHALEAQYDAVVRGAENALAMAEDGELPSGDEIAAQLEEFLREMDDTGKGSD